MTDISVLFAFPRTTLRISKGVLEALGEPTHLSIYLNADAVAMMIRAADEKVVDCLPLPTHYFKNKSKGMKVGRKTLMEAIRLRLGWDSNGTYKIYGLYNSELNAVVFRASEAVKVV